MDLPITHRGGHAQGGSSISDNIIIAEELWPDILKRLPAKSICRFQCVCKSWKSLLSSNFFANHLLAFTTAAACSNERRADAQASLTFDIYSCVLHRPQDNNTFTPLHLPLQPRPNHIITCVGVIRGVVCLYYLPHREVSSRIALWNPAIHKYLTIPRGHLDTRPVLGFDARKNDFKIVRLEGDEYEVFSVRDGLWRRKPLPDHLKPLGRLIMYGCFVDESIYWVTTIKGPSEYGLLVFECGREEFRTMELPKHVTGDVCFPIVTVLAWGGLLVVLKFVSPLIPEGCHSYIYSICEVWAMQKDGDTCDWRKLGPMDHTGGAIIAQRFRVTPYDKGHDQQFLYVIDPCAEVYDFEESMLLMDIGKPCGQDEVVACA